MMCRCSVHHDSVNYYPSLPAKKKHFLSLISLHSLTPGHFLTPHLSVGKRAIFSRLPSSRPGEKKMGTDEETFNVILVTQSPAQLQAIMAEYDKFSKKGLIKAIESETSGDYRHALLAIGEAQVTGRKATKVSRYENQITGREVTKVTRYEGRVLRIADHKG